MTLRSPTIMTTTSIKTISLDYTSNCTTLFENISSMEYAILLDSCSDCRKDAGIDVLAANPYLRFIAHNNLYEIYDSQNQLLEKDEGALSRLLQLESNENGSLLGYFGYHCNDLSYFKDNCFQQEKKLQTNNELPDICLGFYHWRVEIDHTKKTCELKYLADKIDGVNLENLLTQLCESSKLNENNLSTSYSTLANSNFTKNEYLTAFEKIKAYIQSGDCYQINLAQRFTLPFSGDSWQHYQNLRRKSPAPYACFFSTPFGDVLCFSPESFLKISRTGKIISQPIKGTRKRDKDQNLDLLAVKDLESSEKDKSENLMIVDLIRNDLSKSAVLNSVKVDNLFKIQSFANVHHMVSQISAQKSDDKSHLDVLLDCFPGGSITGAPKKRAMEIISELEPHNRQVYCGAIGQINFENDMEFNIAIRTLVIKDNMIYCWGGGGLVADSKAEDEYQESILKISNLIPI